MGPDPDNVDPEGIAEAAYRALRLERGESTLAVVIEARRRLEAAIAAARAAGQAIAPEAEADLCRRLADRLLSVPGDG